MFTRDDVERLADLAREHDLWVISDEAYEDVLYNGAEHVSIASLPGMYERTVPVCTLSKTYAATGVRVGYLAARDERLRGLGFRQVRDQLHAAIGVNGDIVPRRHGLFRCVPGG